MRVATRTECAYTNDTTCGVSQIARLLATLRMLTTRANGRSYAAASECGGYWRLEKWRQWRQRNIAKVKNRKNENRENSAKKNGETWQLFEN